MYRRTFNDEELQKFQVIDLRSDTIAVPTQEMREAMFNAVVGDDVYGEDPTLNALEERVAKLLGKEASIFVPSGTMANLIAILVHCDKRGSELMCGDWSHVFKHEQGSSASLGGVFVHKMDNLEDGTFSIDYVREHVRGEDFHEPITQLVTIEQTHNMMGGKVVPLEWIEELSKVCKEKSLKLHMDGARVFNAAEYLKVPIARVVRDVDSVSFCLSKNLCCPAGSMLVGSRDFIDKARRTRKALGGGMRQVGFLAAAGHAALDTIVPLLGNDHRHTREIAQAIDGLSFDSFRVDIKNIHSNILMIKTCGGKFTALELSNRLAEVKADEVEKGICDASGRGIVIKSCCKNLLTLRLVCYRQITDELAQLAIMKIMHVMKELVQ